MMHDLRYDDQVETQDDADDDGDGRFKKKRHEPFAKCALTGNDMVIENANEKPKSNQGVQAVLAAKSSADKQWAASNRSVLQATKA